MPPNPSSSLRTRRGFIRQALCAAVGTAAISNTIRDLRFINSAVAQSASLPSPTTRRSSAFSSTAATIPTTFSFPRSPRSTPTTRPSARRSSPFPNTDGSGATALALNNLTNDGHTYGIHPAVPGTCRRFSTAASWPGSSTSAPGLPRDESAIQRRTPSRCRPSFSRTRTSRSNGKRPFPTACRRPGGAGAARTCSTRTIPKVSGNDVLSMCISLAGSNTFEVGGTDHAIFGVQQRRGLAQQRRSGRQPRAPRADQRHEQP